MDKFKNQEKRGVVETVILVVSSSSPIITKDTWNCDRNYHNSVEIAKKEELAVGNTCSEGHVSIVQFPSLLNGFRSERRKEENSSSFLTKCHHVSTGDETALPEPKINLFWCHEGQRGTANYMTMSIHSLSTEVIVDSGQLNSTIALMQQFSYTDLVTQLAVKGETQWQTTVLKVKIQVLH